MGGGEGFPVDAMGGYFRCTMYSSQINTNTGKTTVTFASNCACPVFC